MRSGDRAAEEAVALSMAQPVLASEMVCDRRALGRELLRDDLAAPSWRQAARRSFASAGPLAWDLVSAMSSGEADEEQQQEEEEQERRGAPSPEGHAAGVGNSTTLPNASTGLATATAANAMDPASSADAATEAWWRGDERAAPRAAGPAEPPGSSVDARALLAGGAPGARGAAFRFRSCPARARRAASSRRTLRSRPTGSGSASRPSTWAR